MDERMLSDRFHEALDVEPRAGAYDRLRTALAKSTVKPQQRPAFPIKWSRMGLRLAAVMTVVVLAIAAVAAFLATHRVADRIAPADSEHAITAYKLMVYDDYGKVYTAASAWTCNSGSQLAACEADGNRMLPLTAQFLDDLNRSQVPPRFAVVHAQLLVHIPVQSSRTKALIAASRAHDAASADRELAAINGETGAGWGSLMFSSILRSQQGTVATYIESVRSEKRGLDGCTACQDLSGPNQISCAGSQAANCEDLIATTARQVKNFQSAVVVIAAPSSLTAKDNRLQLDLGQAENALKAMVDALAAGDQSRFDAGWNSLRLAMPAVNRDAADIVGS